MKRVRGHTSIDFAIKKFNKELRSNTKNEIDLFYRKRKNKNINRIKRKIRKINKFNHLQNPRKKILLSFSYEEKIKLLKEWAEKGVYRINYRYISKRKKRNKVSADICEVCNINDAYCMHHIWPLSMGGKNNKENLIAICEECHEEIHPWMKGRCNRQEDK